MRYRHALTTIMALGLLFVVNFTHAQAYKNAIGFRVGSPFGLTYKHLFNANSGFEGIIGTRGRSIEIVGLYEYHIYPAKKAPEFDLYFGGGAHVGFYGGYGPNPRPKDRGPFWKGRPYWAYDDPYVGAGLDAIVGCSYTFKNAPINLGIDYKPAFAFYRYIGYIRGDAAISVRFVL